MRTLKSLRPGAAAHVVRVHGRGTLRLRIMEMGLTPGAAVRVRKIAPLGDPIEILVRGYALSLRKADAALVEVAAEAAAE
jgi:ferrous iron transport protein A